MNDTKLSAEISGLDGVPVISVHGEIDLYTVPEFRDALQECTQRKPHVLIVDLTDISYIDSAGLGALLSAYRTLAENKAKLYVISNPHSPGVRRVLEITRLDMVIPVRSTLDEVRMEIARPKAA